MTLFCCFIIFVHIIETCTIEAYFVSLKTNILLLVPLEPKVFFFVRCESSHNILTTPYSPIGPNSCLYVPYTSNFYIIIIQSVNVKQFLINNLYRGVKLLNK
ncbi:hypothetical protein AAHE18_05G255400 [Arachis hypogaea]